MKKNLISILMLVCFLFVFVACDDQLGEKYWETTATIATEVFTSEDFENAYNIQYSDNIQTIINNSYGSNYAELTYVFKPLFTSTISYAYNHYADLKMAPKNENNAFKNAVKKVVKNLNEFKKDVEAFNVIKTDYESNINFTSEEKANSDIELSRLLLFKRDYISLIESAYTLSESVFEARRAGYFDLTIEDQTMSASEFSLASAYAVNASNLQIVNCAIKIVRSYNAKNIASEYQNYWGASNDFYQNVVTPYEADSYTPVTDVQKYRVWLGMYELFVSDAKEFEEAINYIDVDLLKKNDNNPAKYAKTTGNDKDEIYADYFLNFYTKIGTLKQYTLNLFE